METQVAHVLVCPKSKALSGNPPEVSVTSYQIWTNPETDHWEKWGTCPPLSP